MNHDLPLQQLQQQLHAILCDHPQGLSEYELLGHCQTSDQPNGLTERNGLESLFHNHFLLFHCLYRLRDALLAEQLGNLEIHTLRIRLLAYESAGAQALGPEDRLRDYYLDLSQLEGMDAQRVADLIAQFWTRHQAQDARADALATLGLRDPVDAPTIKQTYRRLAMRHHPDRGGDAAQLQAIHQAMQTLALTR